ncbi:glutamate--tRNA ligase [Alicyclobacillus fastidiosus]|uniref:Glutamate--tRNA ligase n=1 Tax=Alicyclobacillus fastidiosus TaxID=392011 RepID=A0ABV5AFL7_9BACL|nr:glutamate--tRNA ligase [Alicyclobacillus fastidiosus]WEH11633.1 glutamate--tRNA ligase [Alicyclobacillus fastidiosus]
MDKQVRVRFAPSPTGALHIGGARTAYFNWLYARQHNGVFVLRIDDTDRARSTEASYEQILDSFRWLGIDWDEGPDVGGEFGPYRQSERMAIYEEQLARLREANRVYPCFCTQEELQAEREAAQQAGRAPRYSGKCRHLSTEEVASRMADGMPHVYRLRVQAEGETVVHDVIRGDVVFRNEEIDDFIVWKADGTPTYHFASCVDDAKMEITHIIRAEEHLSNTPRHVVLFTALGFDIPLFAHVPMILAPDRSKLSKRHGATSVSEYREQGILPEALVNYLLLLGFSPGEDREVLTREEAVQVFSLEQVAKHAAVYDVKKLEWMNAQYYRAQSPDTVLEQVLPVLFARGWVDEQETNRERVAWLRTAIEFVLTRSRNEADLIEGLRYYFEPVTRYDEKGVKKQFSDQEVPLRLRKVAERLNVVAPFATSRVETAFRALIDELGVKGGQLIHPTRLALTGITVGPGLFDIMVLLGRDECVSRLRAAADLIEAGTVAVSQA